MLIFITKGLFRVSPAPPCRAPRESEKFAFMTPIIMFDSTQSKSQQAFTRIFTISMCSYVQCFFSIAKNTAWNVGDEEICIIDKHHIKWLGRSHGSFICTIIIQSISFLNATWFFFYLSILEFDFSHTFIF